MNAEAAIHSALRHYISQTHPTVQTSNLSKPEQPGFLRQSSNATPSPTLEPNSPPKARRPTLDPNASPQVPQVPRLSRTPNFPGIYANDDDVVPVRSSARRRARDKISLSPPPRVASQPPLPTRLRIDLECESSTKRKPSRRQSGPPESVAQPPHIPSPDHRDPPSWAQQPQTAMNYPYYPSTPYDATPFIPPLSSVYSTPATQPCPESPGSYCPAPSLPFYSGIPHTAYGGPPGPPGVQISADFAGHPTSFQGTPWAPPQLLPSPPHPAYVGYTPWQHPTQQPPPNEIPEPPGDTPSRWIHNVDRMDPFAEGPHCAFYSSPNLNRQFLLTRSVRRTDGPVLEPFLAKIVGAVIKLNPLLAPPADSQDDHLRWNMLFQTSNCYRTTESQRSWVKGRNAPATHPRVAHVCIISRAFPWMIHARAHNPKLGVTCGEVLDAVSTCMYADVSKEEYENLPAGRRRQIRKSYRFNRSTDSNAPGGRLGEGLKRLDWLSLTSRFGGLVVNDTFVEEHCGDVLPCTFELKCLPSYPLTAEEVREELRRLENPPRRRSRSRPANSRQPSPAVGDDTHGFE